jgi:cysteine-S-conjugate beta-lyase
MKPDTLLTTSGRDPDANFGIINPPVYHASTILYPTLDALEASAHNRQPGKVYYGRYGTPTMFALEEAVMALDGAYRSIPVGSGMAAIACALSAFVKAGDHILVVDTAYGPTRRYCDTVLKRFGVETTYYDPHLGAQVAGLVKSNTRLIFLEAPGSLTFEMMDVPAVVAVARKAGLVTILDNTWATPLFFRPLALGVDVSVMAATKYIGGHSDLMMGLLSVTKEAYGPVKQMVNDFGCCSGPDDCYLALRGLRTMGVRLPRHQETGILLARWLAAQPEVDRVLHPALPGDPGHALWKRDFKGASGLFSYVLKPVSRPALAAMLDGMKLFGMGYSWGGFESLMLPAHPEGIRTARPWTEKGILMRVHAGLEDPADLIADLEAGFVRLHETEGRGRREAVAWPLPSA